jgi:hypothetical protein
MPSDGRAKIIHRRTPASAAMLVNVKRAMAITAALNRLTFTDADEVRALFSELIGRKVDESFLLIPPFYTAGGDEIRVGRNVFVNQVDRSRRDHHRRRNAGREFGRRGRFGRHQDRAREYSCRRKSSAGHSLDRRMRRSLRESKLELQTDPLTAKLAPHGRSLGKLRAKPFLRRYFPKVSSKA